MAVTIVRGAVLGKKPSASQKANTTAFATSAGRVAQQVTTEAAVSFVRPRPGNSERIRDQKGASAKASELAERIRDDAEEGEEAHGEFNVSSSRDWPAGG